MVSAQAGVFAVVLRRQILIISVTKSKYPHTCLSPLKSPFLTKAFKQATPVASHVNVCHPLQVRLAAFTSGLVPADSLRCQDREGGENQPLGQIGQLYEQNLAICEC